jgi:hypothetical protein
MLTSEISDAKRGGSNNILGLLKLQIGDYNPAHTKWTYSYIR